MNFSYLAIPNPDAMVFQLAVDEQRATVAVATELEKHDKIGAPVTALRTTIASTASTLAETAGDLSDAGFTKQAVRLVDAKVVPAYALVIESTYAARRELEAEWAKLHTPRFPEGSEPAVRAEQRAWWRGLSMPKKIEAANSDPALVAAIVEAGPAMSTLPADVFDRLKRDMAIEQLTDNLARSHDFRTPQTPTDPIAGRADREAARKVAVARFERLEAERELIASVSPLLTSVIDATATLTGESRLAAFERLNA